MILFLYGEDTFRSHQKLAQIKAKFIDASLGDTNLSVADCADKDLDYTEITRMVLAMPFLAKSRLVIIKNLLSEGKKKLQEQMIEFLDKIPESTVLVIYESEKVDRRMALFKALNKSTISTYEESIPSTMLSRAYSLEHTRDRSGQVGTSSPPRRCKIQAQEFKLLEPYELKKWIKNEVESQGGTIDNPAIDKLVEYVGNDLWRISNEIRKLTTYNLPAGRHGLQLTTSEVELLVRPRITANVFDLIDAIGAQNIKRAQSELHKLLNSGQNELYIHTMIVYQFRNLLIIKDLLENQRSKLKNQNDNLKIKNNVEIAKQSGLHPYVAEKTIAQAKNYTTDRLKEIYQILLDYDIKMKTGKIEPKLALDLLIVDLI